VQTDGFTLTEQQPANNIVRVTLQALAAVLGGCQSLHTNSFDEALALPSEEAVQVALRTQQIIAHESGVTNTVDPLGGSYYVEWLTDQMEERCYKYFDEIEAQGGVIPAIEKGYFQREIARSAYEYQKSVDEKRRIVVGVNSYVVDEEEPIELLKMDPEGEKKQINRLKKLRRERDNQKVERMLARLRKAAEGDENLMPHILDAVNAYATLGEICDVFREVFGTYKEPATY